MVVMVVVMMVMVVVVVKEEEEEEVEEKVYEEEKKKWGDGKNGDLYTSLPTLPYPLMRTLPDQVGVYLPVNLLKY